MKLIKPSFEIIKQQPELEGLYKQVELAGRTCYKSEDKITEDSAKEFVDRMIKSGHGAMLEHGTVYLALDMTSRELYFKYCTNKYSKADSIGRAADYSWKGFVTTNLRVLVENDWLSDLAYLCEPTEHHEKRISVKFVCDRGVSHEFVRHRVFSFAQESTRYCNYSKDKFNNEITYIIPCWCDNIIPESVNGWDNVLTNRESCNLSEKILLQNLQTNENTYNFLIEQGWKPQQARAILPNALKTELVMTGFVSDWKHFFKLRDAGSAHPQARELAQPLHEEFIKRNFIKE